MTEKAILYAAASFAGALLVHVLIWRRRVPRNDTLLLFWIFLIFPLGAYGAAGLYCISAYDLPTGDIVAYLAFIFFLHAALSLAYISAYPAFQAASPSLDILLIIASARDGRMAETEIVRRYTADSLVGDRIRDLLNYDLIRRDGDRYSVLPRARRIAGFFALYRKFLGLPMGEG